MSALFRAVFSVPEESRPRYPTYLALEVAGRFLEQFSDSSDSSRSAALARADPGVVTRRVVE